MHQRIGTGSTAGHDLQFAADGVFYPPGQSHQLLHLLRCGLNSAIAAEIHAHARQMHTRQVALHMDTGGDKFVPVPEALPQIAQIRHDDNGMGLVLPLTFLLQRVQYGTLALQGHIAQGYCVGKFCQAGDADQQKRSFYPGGTALGDLLQTAGADLYRTRLAHRVGHLRHTIHTLDDAAHLNPLLLTAGDHLMGVMIQPVQMYLQAGKLPVHGFHLIFCQYYSVYHIFSHNAT